MQGPDQGLAINSTSFQPKVDLLELKGGGLAVGLKAVQCRWGYC